MKKFLLSFTITSIITIIIYFLIHQYDNSWVTIQRITTNIYYIIFLYISIVIYFWIWETKNSKLKLIKLSLFIINFIYIWYSYLIWSIWLTTTSSLILLWLITIWITWSFIRKRFWSIITILSIIWCLIIVYLSLIPLYEKWPDIQWFQDSLNTKLITYSKITINPDKAKITLNQKEYNILNWLNTYDFSLWNSWSELIFKSYNIYSNTFWFILFNNWDFIQINPQSAIIISQNFEIEIITWEIYYYPNEYKNFIFSWENNAKLQNNEEIINIIKWRYNNQLKLYIKNNMWWDINQNEIILMLSNKTLEILSKLFPWKYEKNIENFNNFVKLLDLNIEKSPSYEKINNKWIYKNILNSFKNWINAIN